MDIPPVGRKFTSYSNWTAKSRFQKILFSQEWLEQWYGRKQYILDGRALHHCVKFHTNNTTRKSWNKNYFLMTKNNLDTNLIWHV